MTFNPRLLYAGIALFTTIGPFSGLAHAAPKQTGFNFVAYGDTRSNARDHAAIIREILRLKPEFVLQSGDLVANGRNAAQWAQFAQIEKPLDTAHIAYYPARGNHDDGKLYYKWVREPFDSGNKDYYAFTRHNNRFIIVNESGDDSIRGRFDDASPQYKWLKFELQKAHQRHMNTFVMFHEGPYSVGPHGPNLDVQKWLVPLFTAYKVSMVINGHDHLYYRTKRDGVVYVITGGGGAELYQPVRAYLAQPGDFYVSKHHVILLHVDGPKITGTVYTPDNKVIDRFTINNR